MVVVVLAITKNVKNLQDSITIHHIAMKYTAKEVIGFIVSMRAEILVSMNTGTTASTILLDARNTTVVQTIAALIIKYPFLNGYSAM